MIEKYPVGSRETCNPPPTDTDEDTLVFTDIPGYGDFLVQKGWAMSTDYPGTDFTSYKKGDQNYIVTYSEAFRDKFLLATRVSKNLNLLKKEDRVTLFQSILYGNG